MLTAKNSEGIVVQAINANKSEKYYCKSCGQELLLKQGGERIWHFAHAPKNKCTDTWHYEPKTFWHKNWQDKFPIENQEVAMQNETEKHIADIFINDTVIEFQHSTMSFAEFKKRNDFYTSLGHRVVWVFDVCKNIENKLIPISSQDGFYEWKGKFKDIFFNEKYENPNVEIYIQLYMNASDNQELQEIIKLKERVNDNDVDPNLFDSYLYEEYRNYLNDHKNDKTQLIKIRWGVRCVKSINYILVLDNDSRCDDESFSSVVFANKGGEEPLLPLKKCNNLKINPIKVNNGCTSNDEATSHSIDELWRELQPSIAIFENLKTGYFVKLYQSSFEQHKCYGYLSKNRYKFPNYKSEIYGVKDKVWICVFKR